MNTNEHGWGKGGFASTALREYRLRLARYEQVNRLSQGISPIHVEVATNSRWVEDQEGRCSYHSPGCSAARSAELDDLFVARRTAEIAEDSGTGIALGLYGSISGPGFIRFGPNEQVSRTMELPDSMNVRPAF